MRAVKRAINSGLRPMMQFVVVSGEVSGDDLGEQEKLIRSKRKLMKTDG